MPKGSKQNEIQKAWAKKRLAQKPVAGAKPTVSEPKRARAGGRQEQPDSTRSKDTVRMVRPPAKVEPVVGGFVELPQSSEKWLVEDATPQDIKDARSGKYGTNSLSAVVYLRKVREGSMQIQRVLQNSVPPPTYAKPRPVIGFFAKRIGKWFRPKPKKEISQLSPTEMKQAQKFNVTTSQIKSAIATVAVLATVFGGMLGKEVLVDEQTIESAVQVIWQGYMGLLAVIAAATWILRTVKNVYSNWSRITEHGVKIAGPNADLAFDFAPKDNR